MKSTHWTWIIWRKTTSSLWKDYPKSKSFIWIKLDNRLALASEANRKTKMIWMQDQASVEDLDLSKTIEKTGQIWATSGQDSTWMTRSTSELLKTHMVKSVEAFLAIKWTITLQKVTLNVIKPKKSNLAAMHKVAWNLHLKQKAREQLPQARSKEARLSKNWRWTWLEFSRKFIEENHWCLKSTSRISKLSMVAQLTTKEAKNSLKRSKSIRKLNSWSTP